MDTQALQQQLTQLMTQYGDLGVFIAMFLESSVVPIPSEVVILGAGALGLPLLSIIIFGSLGSTLGGVVGYSLGRYGAMPVILKFGKYVFIKPHHIYKAEAFAKKYGVWSVLIGRLLPIVPFKVFSIAAGFTKIPVFPFMTYTLLGVIPRIFLLAWFGNSIVKYTKPTLLIVFCIILIIIAVKVTHTIYSRKKLKNL